jgi:hypothetical protein
MNDEHDPRRLAAIQLLTLADEWAQAFAACAAELLSPERPGVSTAELLRARLPRVDSAAVIDGILDDLAASERARDRRRMRVLP